jgi:L-amino acid N-acyltransferase YncA
MMTNAILRLATTQDAAQVAAIYTPYVLDTPASFELDPPTEEEMGKRIAGTLEKTPWLVCEHDGEIHGYAYASLHRPRAAYRWSVNVSAYVRAGRQRRGMGRALYTALLGLLPLQGFYSAYAGITLPNAASVGLHETLGFTLVGVYRDVGYKLGRWHDVGWWQRSLGEHPPDPREPLALRQVIGSPGWQAALASGQDLLG